jgi:hypothetical protein
MKELVNLLERCEKFVVDVVIGHSLHAQISGGVGYVTEDSVPWERISVCFCDSLWLRVPG